MTRNGTLGRGDTTLATAIAAGMTYAAAADRAGVSERTAKRRMTDQGFRNLVSEIQLSTLEESVRRLSGLSVTAIETLADLMKVDRPAQTRLGAARTVLDSTLRWQELGEILRRLEQLEDLRATGWPT